VSDGHTIDVGYVHTFTDDTRTTHRPDCPHPKCILGRADQSRAELLARLNDEATR